MSRTPDNNTPASSLETLREALQSGTMRQVRRQVNALNPAEIADLLESLPPAQREIVWELVATEDEGDVLVELNEKVRASLISEMDSKELVAAVATMDLDDLADLIAELPEAVNREVLRSLDTSDRLRLQSVLKYDEDSAGGLMNPDTITVRADVSLDVVLRYLRMRKELPAGTDAVFVVSRSGDYLGSLYLMNLITSDPNEAVSAVMDTSVPAINANAEAAQVATIWLRLPLSTMPASSSAESTSTTSSTSYARKRATRCSAWPVSMKTTICSRQLASVPDADRFG
jgi:magnesium transporter